MSVSQKSSNLSKNYNNVSFLMKVLGITSFSLIFVYRISLLIYYNIIDQKPICNQLLSQLLNIEELYHSLEIQL
jgi:hypothetical protein